MREQVVGLFQREESVVEAAQMLHGGGYGFSDLDLVSKEAVHDSALSALLLQVRPGRLMERPEGMWPCALWWASIGSCVMEVPVLICVLVVFDSWAIQLLLRSTLWKFGALFGGIFGAIVGSDRGLEANAAHRYEKHLAHGSIVLAARVHHNDAPHARGIFIESGAFDIRNVEGRFIAKGSPDATETPLGQRDSSPRGSETPAQ